MIISGSRIPKLAQTSLKTLNVLSATRIYWVQFVTNTVPNAGEYVSEKTDLLSYRLQSPEGKHNNTQN